MVKVVDKSIIMKKGDIAEEKTNAIVLIRPIQACGMAVMRQGL
ncbi:MAG: hypothetical protein H6Q67_559 [Firmicutes bacterium]|nr:hypothetical protein [Bacillota bacterium]